MFKKLLGKVKDAHTQDSDTGDAWPLDTQTLVSILRLFQDTNLELRVALLEREQGSREAPQACREEIGCNLWQSEWATLQRNPVSTCGKFVTCRPRSCSISACAGLSPLLSGGLDQWLAASMGQSTAEAWD